ncbi:MAG: isoprenylcysteine carboxylmethyltransferase family protein [Gammaproteobacteria bacterium]
MTNRSVLLPPGYLLIAIVIMLALHFSFPMEALLYYPLNLAGAIPLLVGIILNIMADKLFKQHNTTVKSFQESSALITSGTYRICRHPMYLGMVFILLGLAVLLGSWLSFLVLPVFAVVMELRFVRVEERMLEQKFGKSWLAYKQRVRRWI